MHQLVFRCAARGSVLVLLPSPDWKTPSGFLISGFFGLLGGKPAMETEPSARQEGNTEAADVTQPHLLQKFARCRTEPPEPPTLELEISPGTRFGTECPALGFGVSALAWAMG